MEFHICMAHPESSVDEHKHLYKLLEAERKSMQTFWRDRKTIIVRRSGKSKAVSDLVISEAHVSMRALAPR